MRKTWSIYPDTQILKSYKIGHCSFNNRFDHFTFYTNLQYLMNASFEYQTWLKIFMCKCYLSGHWLMNLEKKIWWYNSLKVLVLIHNLITSTGFSKKNIEILVPDTSKALCVKWHTQILCNSGEISKKPSWKTKMWLAHFIKQ